MISYDAIMSPLFHQIDDNNSKNEDVNTQFITRFMENGFMMRNKICWSTQTVNLSPKTKTQLIGPRLRLRQDGRHFADDIFLNENVWISIKILLKFVPKGQIYKSPALFQIMAWRRPGDKPLSEIMVVRFTDAYMRHSTSMS